MISATSSDPPARRRTLGLWALLALGTVAGAYLLVLILAALFVYLPYLWLKLLGPDFWSVAISLCCVAMAASMIWSLLPRRDRFAAPGVPLDATRQPRLFAELEAIAGALSQPMPEAVYLVPEVNAWVADRGGLMGVGRRRVMGLGLPLLATLGVSQLRAVLAHEFAHFYGGDTRLGPWVYRSRTAMAHTAANLGRLRALTRIAAVAVLYAATMRMLTAYWKLSLRATQSVSRRQETRADELAARLAGPRALIEGLQRIHAGATMLRPFWETALAPTLASGWRPPVAEGFRLFLAAPDVARAADAAVAHQLQKGTGQPFDSHPPLRERVTAAGRMPAFEGPQDARPATALVDDLPELEARLLAKLNPAWQEQHLQSATWDAIQECQESLWRRWVGEQPALLAGIDAASLPEAVAATPRIGAKIPDPQGTLLTPEQRADRATRLLGLALALSLLDSGWRLHASPGEFYLNQGGERLNPLQVAHQLRSGQLSRESWLQTCRRLNIGSLLLAPRSLPASADGAPARVAPRRE